MAEIIVPEKTFASSYGIKFPNLIARAGEDAAWRFLEFFTATIRNKNTRLAYANAIVQLFEWCDYKKLELDQINPVVIAGYIESHPAAAPTIKQHLSAIRMLFDWLVTGHIVQVNPATSVRGPKHVVKKGKTPVLDVDQARKLLDSIDISTAVGLRDRALIGTMVFSFARVSAVIGMKMEDYYQNGKRWWIRLHEKGGKYHEVPAHHTLEEYLDEYRKCLGDVDSKSPLFRSARGRTGTLAKEAIDRSNVLRMIYRRAKQAGLPEKICCHTFRATGITAYLKNGGTIENAQAIAAHESPRTTKLYDRRSDEITLDEIEKIRI